MGCVSCHTPRWLPAEDAAGGVHERALLQIAEKRGFLFEHAPVREDCTSCHAPHGSNHKRLWPRSCRTSAGTAISPGPATSARATTVDRTGAAVRATGATGYPANSRFVESPAKLPRESNGSNSPSALRFIRPAMKTSLAGHHAPLPRRGLPHGGSFRKRPARAGGPRIRNCAINSAEARAARYPSGCWAGTTSTHPGSSNTVKYRRAFPSLLQPVLEERQAGLQAVRLQRQPGRPALSWLVQDQRLRPSSSTTTRRTQRGQRRPHHSDRDLAGRLGDERHLAAGAWHDRECDAHRGPHAAVLRHAPQPVVRGGRQRGHHLDAPARKRHARSQQKLPFNLSLTHAGTESGYRGEEGGGIYSAVSSVMEIPEPLNEITQDIG